MEGRAFRRMGHAYGLPDFLADLRRNTTDRALLGHVKHLIRGGRLLAGFTPWLQPLARFVGNRFYPRALTKDSQGFTVPASGPGR